MSADARKKPEARRPVWPILAGVLAGAVGAIVAAIVSIPLRSPDDLIGNSASVTLGALAVGIASGVYWRRVHDQADASRKLWMFAAVGFGAAVVLFVILEVAVLSRFASFGIPLAAIIFGSVALLTPIFTTMRMPTWIPLVAVVVAFIVGGLLAGYGDAASGDLALEDLPTLSQPAATSPPVTAEQPSPSSTSDTTAATPGGILGELAATSFEFTNGTATWSVPETFLSTGLDVTAVGRSEGLQGNVDLAGSSTFTVDLTTFVSDQERRDSRVRSLFAADPIATFTTSSLVLPESYVEGDVFVTDVAGDLTINGITNAVTWSIEARLTGTQLDVTGELDIVLTDFNVTPPSVGGFVTVEDSARLEVLFSATP